MTLELKQVAKRLGSFTLPPLDLTVEEGEYLVLVGPSGVGKTVLLEIITGLINPDAGHICWRGRDVTSSSPEHRGFGIVYQDYALFPHMTVFENIIYGLKSKRMKTVEAHERAEVVSTQLDIRSLFDRLPGTLSGGEAQRVALARALVVEPDVLLLDEPLSAVDMRLRRLLRRELKRAHERTGTTFVHVTHDVQEALMLGHRVGVMLDGRLHQVDEPTELFYKPTDRDVADFLGMRNIFPADRCEEGTCEFAGVTIHVGERTEPFRYIWIRPEEILLSRGAFESSARNQLSCVVENWELQDVLVNVQVAIGDARLDVLVTFASFEGLGIEEGDKLYATFKSSVVHCF